MTLLVCVDYEKGGSSDNAMQQIWCALFLLWYYFLWITWHITDNVIFMFYDDRMSWVKCEWTL